MVKNTQGERDGQRMSRTLTFSIGHMKPQKLTAWGVNARMWPKIGRMSSTELQHVFLLLRSIIPISCLGQLCNPLIKRCNVKAIQQGIPHDAAGFLAKHMVTAWGRGPTVPLLLAVTLDSPRDPAPGRLSCRFPLLLKELFEQHQIAGHRNIVGLLRLKSPRLFRPFYLSCVADNRPGVVGRIHEDEASFGKCCKVVQDPGI